MCASHSSTPTSLCRHGFFLSSNTMLFLFFAPLSLSSLSPPLSHSFSLTSLFLSLSLPLSRNSSLLSLSHAFQHLLSHTLFIGSRASLLPPAKPTPLLRCLLALASVFFLFSLSLYTFVILFATVTLSPSLSAFSPFPTFCMSLLICHTALTLTLPLVSFSSFSFCLSFSLPLSLSWKSGSNMKAVLDLDGSWNSSWRHIVEKAA